jgi:peptidoglycan/xylan/chitin deacetylase (PgdA/CDA1 family)
MYEDDAITGSSLPDKTLCLTLDDGPGETDTPGPGPLTLELAQYLSDQGVKATFFMVGKYASDLPDVLPQVEALGHLIGNHTYDHPQIVDYLSNGGDVVLQVSRTDGVIRNWIDGPVVYFRPPYGAWSADVARTLNANLTVSLSHVGPVDWDVDGGDWNCWAQNLDPSQCAANYMQAIQNAGHGTVLMHDCTADKDVVKRANRTLELVQLLVPTLQQHGYQFARIDEIPDVVARTRNTLTVALKGSNGLYVSPQDGGGGMVLINGPAVGLWEPIVVEDLSVGKVALRTTSGQYISPQGGGGGSVLANAAAVGAWEPMDLISFRDNTVAFRCSTGDFLTLDESGNETLVATLSLSPLGAENLFSFEYCS